MDQTNVQNLRKNSNANVLQIFAFALQMWLTIWARKPDDKRNVFTLWQEFRSQWKYSVTFATDIERGIQIVWTLNCRAVSEWKIVKEEKDCGYRANNFSLGNGSSIHGSKILNDTFNVGGKSNWVRLLRVAFPSLMRFKILLLYFCFFFLNIFSSECHIQCRWQK